MQIQYWYNISKVKNSICLFILITLSLNSFSQKKQIFSGDTATFPNELKEFMQNVKDQHEGEIDLFLKKWEKDSLFSKSDQAEIIKLSKLLVEKNVKPNPSFLKFLSCLLAFKEFNTEPENYRNWYNGLTELLENKKTTTSQISNVFEFTDILLRKNLIYSSNSVEWKVTSKSYKIKNHDELKVEFESGDLICFAKRDSMKIFNTKGSVFPSDNLWKGSGGLVTWERGGFSREEVFADLKDYEIDLTKSEYAAEDVVFTNKRYFNEPLKGILNDQVRFIKEPDDATYPKFDSYTKHFTIKQLYKNIDYEGGLSMQGSKMVGTGTRENTAKLKIYRNDTLVLIASSLYFGFKSFKSANICNYQTQK